MVAFFNLSKEAVNQTVKITFSAGSSLSSLMAHDLTKIKIANTIFEGLGMSYIVPLVDLHYLSATQSNLMAIHVSLDNGASYQTNKDWHLSIIL